MIKRFVLLIIFSVSSAFGMQKASWNSLPADVKRYAMQFIASSNVYEVAETMKVLNATDRACHALMQSEHVVMSIMQRMPYIANRISLLYRLNHWPIQQRFDEYYENALRSELRNGRELLDATRSNDTERVKALLSQESLDLNYLENNTSTSLMCALYIGHHEIAIALIKAGADIDASNWLLGIEWCVLNRNLIPFNALFQLMLKFGADPNSVNLKGLSLGIPEIYEEQENKKKRMRLLCGKKECDLLSKKKDDGCVIS